jgi:outer membrane immunogenic protein
VLQRQQHFPAKPATNWAKRFEIVLLHFQWSKLNAEYRGLEMKKFLLALTAVAAFSGSALAADMAPRTYTKAPAPMMMPSWTGFYIFGGGGGGIWDANTGVVTTATGACVNCVGLQKSGGDGWFGTVGAGYDWQLGATWVAGIFADGQFGSIKGSIPDQNLAATGYEKLRNSYAGGARVGYLVAPNVLSYVNGGYTYSQWSSTNLTSTVSGAPTGFYTNSFDKGGVFVGGGVENNLDIFGFHYPGLFMKTEYRAAYYGTKTLNEYNAGALGANSITFKPFDQTISTSLVYRFNWTGPVVAKY